MRFQVTTAESALADNELIYFRTRMEGQDLQHLKFGTSSAESLTLSFWVRSSLTGKYSVLLYNDDAQRSNLQSYTVSAADTWEHKTITFDGDTSNGFDDDANRSMTLFFTLAAGTNYTGTPHTGWGAYSATDDYAHSDAVNFAAQTGNWYITGIQLEIGEKRRLSSTICRMRMSCTDAKDIFKVRGQLPLLWTRVGPPNNLRFSLIQHLVLPAVIPIGCN